MLGSATQDAKIKINPKQIVKSVFGVIIIAAVAGGVATVIGLIVWGIVGIVHSNDNDFAGYGPNHVNDHAQTALEAWYGQKSVRKDLRIAGKYHNQIYDQNAWQVNYLTPTDKKICVLVWSGDKVPGSYYGPDDYWIVREGAACG